MLKAQKNQKINIYNDLSSQSEGGFNDEEEDNQAQEIMSGFNRRNKGSEKDCDVDKEEDVMLHYREFCKSIGILR